MLSILIVEGDSLIGHAAKQWLSHEYQVQWSTSLENAYTFVREGCFDVILLDLELPDGNGFELLNYLRRQGKSVGVLIITANGDIDQLVEGLDAGADDYLVTPLNFKELDARIRAVTRRKDGLSSATLEHGKLTLDLNSMNTRLAGVPVHLSHMELSILAILLRGRNRYFSKSMLEQRLYNQDNPVEGNAIEVHIYSVRKKLGKSLIKTTRGLGYIIEKLEAP